ncbi:hypothetical protein CLV51_102414 [Chitinophaga niastensis]|uniref:Uncharacterized protein n=1 Tax=Chitinophaga niastensis TaxID=536980 RepID=A0A2P8HMZ0_CHINA|nr:hypothetical protein CLV51_102414 [Chitinophaga niastensis]
MSSFFNRFLIPFDMAKGSLYLRKAFKEMQKETSPQSPRGIHC